MSTISEAGNISQRLLGRIGTTCPKLLLIIEQTIINLGSDCVSVDSFRKQLNQALRYHLSNLPVDTMEIRICLDDDDNIEYWYMQLTNIVLPFWRDNVKG
jgi:hypothetical protein